MKFVASSWRAAAWRVLAHLLIPVAAFAATALPAQAQRRMENLGRGVVAVRASSSEVFVSWRLLGYEPQDLPFNLYRSANGGAAVKLNPTSLTGGTNFRDLTANLTVTNAYHVRPVVNGVELAAGASFTLPANSPVRSYLSLPLQSTSWSTYVHLVWVGDLDGDGEYDFVVSRLPLEAGHTQLIEGYKRDGTFLWRIDFGPNSVDPDNIEPPASAINAGHNDGVTVYDLDGDGRAEVVIKAANGVVFGNGQTLTFGDNVTQFISVLDGLTGAERARAPVPTDYLPDGPVAGHFGIAYLDGVKPSFIFKAKNRVGSGAFNLFIAAWDFDGTQLTQRWKWLRGNTNAPDDHQIRIVDVDRDGRDEICDGGYVLDDNGTLLYSLGTQGVIHGDRFHIGDLDPDRPGLEGFGIQQNNPSGLLYFTYDAATGEMLHRHFGGIEDTARGTAADITAGHRGYEYWSFHGIHEFKGGTVISPDPKRPWPNFRIWWDGDVLSENLNREIVEKWDPATGNTTRLLTASNDGAVDSWRDAAQFYGDILGDWREEIVFEKSDHTSLLIYTTPIPTSTRLYTLPHNPEYRACFTVKGYLQSNMLDYYLGDGMTPPPMPNITPVLGAGANVPVIVSFGEDTGGSSSDRLTADNTPTLHGIAPPNATVIVSRLGVGDDGTTVADATGAWTFVYVAPLPDGQHYFAARIDNGQNNLSFPFAITIDTLPPAAPGLEAIVADGTGGLIAHGTADPGLRVVATLGGTALSGQAVTDANGRWSIAFAGGSLGAAQYTVAAVAYDAAGNASTPTQRLVDLAVSSPAITAVIDDTGASSTDQVTSDRTLTLAGTATPGSTVTLYRLGVGPMGTVTTNSGGEWTFSDATTLADGTYGFTAFTGSSAGAPAFAVTVDGTAPLVLSIDRLSPSAASSSATGVVYRVTFTEDVSGLDQADFTLVFTGTLGGAVAGITPVGGGVYDVTVGPLSGEGTVRMDLNSGGTGIMDRAGNPLSGGFNTGQSFTRVLFGDGVWTRTETGGVWSGNDNWLGGIVAHGAGTTADFSTIEIPENNLVHLDAPRTVTNVVFGDDDVTSAASWTIDANGNSANMLTLVTGAATPVITVNPLGAGAVANIAAPLAGTTGFSKAGTGTLVLSGSGTLTGSLGVNTGTLRIDAGGRIVPGAVTIASSAAFLNVAGGTLDATGALNLNGGAKFVLDSGIARFASIAASNNTGTSVLVNGGSLIAGTVTFQRSTDGALNYGTGLIVRGGEAQVGAINLGTNNSNGMMSVEGGVLGASGAITLGNQSSGGRGGHLRVTGGVLSATDATPTGGLIITRRNNNTSTANFLGGTSTVEKITLGFDSTVTSGAGTLNVDGGTLYLGSGGIVRNAGGTFAAAINLTNGVLGAKAPWTTSLPITLTSAGNITVKAANALNAAFDIALNGVISGAGSLTKSGAGALALGAANTFTGNVAVNGGTLRVTGSLAAGGNVAVNSGGTLAGDGPIAKPIALNAGGVIAPDGGTAIATLVAGSLTWHGGGTLAIDLGTTGVGDQIALSGALNRGAAGVRSLVLNATAPLVAGDIFTVATFAATDLTATDVTASGLPPGFGARPMIVGTTLRVLVVARPAITSSLIGNGTFGVPFSYAIAGSNGPTSYSATGLPGGLWINSATGVISGTPTAAGQFFVTVGASNEGGTGTATLEIDIAKAPAAVALGIGGPAAARQFYDGSPKSATATTSPAGLAVTYTYNGSATAPVLPGTYDVVASVDDPNYAGTTTGRLVIMPTALVRHAPAIGGSLDGSMQVLNGENFTLAGASLVSGDVLVPGLPVVAQSGSPTLAGVIDATGSATPDAYTVTLGGSAVLRYIVRRVDPIGMPVVNAPLTPAGTRTVTLASPTDDPGSFATIRHLTIRGAAGEVAVPPGAYGQFTAVGTTAFVLGIPGATEPAVYCLQSLGLNGSRLKVVGPIRLVVGSAVTANGATVAAAPGSPPIVIGDAAHAGWLILEISSGGLTLNGALEVHGHVVAPTGRVTLKGGAALHGSVVSDGLSVAGGGLLRTSP